MFKKLKEDKDTGFSATVNGQQGRLMNADGSFNVLRTGINFFEKLSMYHVLLNASWIKFNMLVAIAYLIVNTVFATAYYFIGIEHLSGILGDTTLERFWDAFFFSAQTLTTVGYGRISPVGFWTSVVASVEAMAGLLGFALATGILYGRFSRPVAKILYSPNVLVAPYNNINSLQLRIANLRDHQLIEIEVQLLLSRIEMERNQPMRKFYTLSLERKQISFLATSWTIVHPIDESSPMYGWDKEMIDASDPEIILVIKAFDDTFSQTVHSRASYKHYEMVWGAKFHPMFLAKENHTVLELDKIGDHYSISLNETPVLA
jgi:inward rectifier potassium channel